MFSQTFWAFRGRRGHLLSRTGKQNFSQFMTPFLVKAPVAEISKFHLRELLGLGVSKVFINGDPRKTSPQHARSNTGVLVWSLPRKRHSYIVHVDRTCCGSLRILKRVAHVGGRNFAMAML